MKKLSQEEIQLIKNSGLFDPQWYASQYPDVALSGLDPFEHYVIYGYIFGRNLNKNKTKQDANILLSNSNAKSFLLNSNKIIEEKVTLEGRWIQNNVNIAREEPKPLAPLWRVFNKNNLNIHWIVPDFDKGGGGHMTIFRMVMFLEKFGHYQTIWIQNPKVGRTEKKIWELIREWYQPINNVVVKFLPDIVEGISGDLVIATDMWTAFPASQMTLMKERFYLVQDYEALFHTHGTFKYVADLTYRMRFKVVCAGAWLKRLMENKFNLWTRSWNLAYDPIYYYEDEKKQTDSNDMPRIAIYARSNTPRRAVELAHEAMLILHERGINFCADLFGQENLGEPPPYAHIFHGLLSPKELGNLYRAVDIGLVFSATNYSLIPMEMMACGLPVVELDTESTRAVFPDDSVVFAPPSPNGIADALENLIKSEVQRKALKNGGKQFTSALSWETSARELEAGLIEGLSENNQHVEPKDLFRISAFQYKAAVIIPTWNAGDLFENVLNAVLEQKTKWPFEILILDSGSVDNTLQIVRRNIARGVKLHEIPNSEFQHGRTRNLAISLTSAEFVAVLTQDAMPANNEWLANLIGAFEKSDRIAGVFGAHIPYPDASFFVKKSILDHFTEINKHDHVINWRSKMTSCDWGSLQHQQWLHYYSDNNSALRRSVWEKIPYPEVFYGEDQVWAWEIIKQGFNKAYVNDAKVYHSHNLTEIQQRKLADIEGDFWLRYFNYHFEKTVDEVEASIEYLNHRDRKLANVHNLHFDDLHRQFILNRSALEGRYASQKKIVKNIKEQRIKK